MRPENLPRLTTSVTRVAGESGDGLANLADALLLLTGDPALDEAVEIAHNFNIVKIQRQSRRRVLEHAATYIADNR
jgi:hypothetical protein